VFIQKLWSADVVVVTMAFGLVITGVLFKISAVPLHFWAPDVYATAPLPIVALFSTAPKIAALGFLWHLIYAFAPISSCFAILCLVAGTTLTLGNLAALTQQNFRKLMAWSSIGQGGFLISALLCGTEIGRDAALIYSLFYTLANVCVFELIRLASKDKLRNADHLPSLAGLGLRDKQSMYWGIASLVALLSLVGLPPTGGFTAKFIVFTALLEQYDRGGNWWVMALLVLGLVNTVLALFYYLRIPYQLFMRPLPDGQGAMIVIGNTLADSQNQQLADNEQPILQALPSEQAQHNLTNGLKTNGLVLLLCTLLIIGFLKIDWILGVLQLRIHD
jgi:NADH-quinone oxidoreductase subunit N